MENCCAGGESPSQHSECANLTGSTPSLQRKNALYRDGRMPGAAKTSDVKTGAEKLAGDQRPVLKDQHIWRRGERSLCWYVLYSKSMQRDQRREFVEYHVASELFPAAQTDLGPAFASQKLSRKSDISGSTETRTAAKLSQTRGLQFWPAKKPVYGMFCLSCMQRK